MTTSRERIVATMHVCAAVLFALPLWSLIHVDGIRPSFVAMLAVLGATAAVRPAAGLLALALILPLAFGLASMTGPRFGIAPTVESLVLAYLVGSAARSAVDHRWPADARLPRPAVALAALIVASAACAVLGEFDSPVSAAGKLWRSMTRGYFSGGSIDTLVPSFRWLELIALATYVEAAIRRRPDWRQLVLLASLSAGAAAAAQTALRVAEVAMSRGQGLRTVVDLLAGTRLSPVYPDLNAAGSLFAMLLVTAITLGMRSQRLAMAIVAPFLTLALLATQSRAAVVAACLTLGFLTIRWLFRSGRRVWAGAALIASASALGAVLIPVRSTHVGIDAALESRVEMAKIALKISAEAPAFGVGLGRFRTTSRDYLEPGFVATFPEAAGGENAHNNFLQVLAELGLVGLAAFSWLLWRGLSGQSPPRAGPRGAIVAGLVTFLISALFGHPLLIYEVAAAVFLAIGLAAGMAEQDAEPVARRDRLLLWGFAGLVVISLPWRVADALAPDAPDVVGAGPVERDADGVEYRRADQTSQWLIRAHTRTVVVPMRWEAGGPGDCRISILVNSHLVDEIAASADAWVPVRFAIPPGGLPSAPPLVEFKVSNEACRLMVGQIAAMR